VLESRIGDDRVKPPEALHRGVDRSLVALSGGQIGLEELPGRIRFFWCVEIGGQHVPAVVDEPARNGLPDAAGRTGHERRSSF
jgi:hypothetical protein